MELLLIPILILGYLLWQEQRARRESEHAWRLERTALLQRIQAPEVATLPDFDVPEKAYVGFDDDDEFWEARGS